MAKAGNVFVFVLYVRGNRVGGASHLLPRPSLGLRRRPVRRNLLATSRGALLVLHISITSAPVPAAKQRTSCLGPKRRARVASIVSAHLAFHVRITGPLVTRAVQHTGCLGPVRRLLVASVVSATLAHQINVPRLLMSGASNPATARRAVRRHRQTLSAAIQWRQAPPDHTVVLVFRRMLGAVLRLPPLGSKTGPRRAAWSAADPFGRHLGG